MSEIIQINDNTWRFEDGFVRFFLLIGSNKAALIDSGVASIDAISQAKTLTDKEIILINTHGDGDHTSGTAAFDKIYMHEADYINCGLKEKYPETSLVKVDDGDILELGDRPLRIIHIPGHTKGSIAILDKINRSLFAGDSVQKGHIFMFGNHRSPEEYAASLDLLVSIEAEYDCIYASHDEYMLSSDYARIVRDAWDDVRSEKASYEMADLFGNQVKSYTFDVCGFYL